MLGHILLQKNTKTCITVIQFVYTMCVCIYIYIYTHVFKNSFTLVKLYNLYTVPFIGLGLDF